MLSFFPRGVLDEILNLVVSVSEDFPSYSTVNQLLKIVHQIYQDINDGKDTCLVFLDISKAFDKDSHEGLLFKIKRLSITGKLLYWLKDYITDRHQNVVLNSVSLNL